MTDLAQVALVAFGVFIALMLAECWLELRSIRRALERKNQP